MLKDKGNIQNIMKRMIAFIMVFMVVITSTAVGVEAASKKFCLPSKATIYLYNDETGNWEKSETKVMKYNSKGDPVVYGKQKISYKYRKKSKRKKMVINSTGEGHKTTYYYNTKGILYKTSLNGNVSFNKNNWATKTSDGMKINYITYSSGYPKKIYTITPDYTSTYINSNGLPESVSSLLYGERTYYRYTYTYDKKGRVKTATQEVKYEGESEWQYSEKAVYTYPKKPKKTTLRRKWAVIIACALTAEGNGICELGPFFEATQANAVYDQYYVY